MGVVVRGVMAGGGLSRGTQTVDLRSILNLDGTDLVEAPLHDVLALQHELTALSLEVLLLPDCDLELAHLLHLLSVHGCCFSLGGYTLIKDIEDVFLSLRHLDLITLYIQLLTPETDADVHLNL